jgi:hypothetical protein
MCPDIRVITQVATNNPATEVAGNNGAKPACAGWRFAFTAAAGRLRVVVAVALAARLDRWQLGLFYKGFAEKPYRI